MDQFNKDIAELKSYDGISPSRGPGGSFLTRADSNPNAGEVEVEGVGKLLPTEDGGWEAEISHTHSYAGVLWSQSRSYSINTNGSITVLDESTRASWGGAMLGGAFLGSSQDSKLYTLDPAIVQPS